MPTIDLAGLNVFYFYDSFDSFFSSNKMVSSCGNCCFLSSMIHSMKTNHLKLPCVMIANALLRRVGFAADILL